MFDFSVRSVWATVNQPLNKSNVMMARVSITVCLGGGTVDDWRGMSVVRLAQTPSLSLMPSLPPSLPTPTSQRPLSLILPPSFPPSLPPSRTRPLVGSPDGKRRVEGPSGAWRVHVVPDHARLWHPIAAAVLGDQCGTNRVTQQVSPFSCIV